MNSGNLIIGLLFLSESTMGILGNVSLPFNYLVFYQKKKKLKPMDLILMHLIMVNSLIILFKGLPNTVAAFGLKQFFNYWNYQFFLYVLRVFRSMSIVTTCLLSVFQAITISPRNSCWKNLKVKSPRDIGLYISVCWVFYIMVNVIFPVYVSIKFNRKNKTKETEFEHHTSVGHDKVTVSSYITFFVFPELLFSVLITWSSSSMIVNLYSHKQRVQYIYSTHVSHRRSMESRATQSILALVSTFLVFYTFSAILHGCTALLYSNNSWLVNITAIITLCFPTLSPFILKSQDSTVSRTCFIWIKGAKFPMSL
ncbi:vomeronasal type-1 receptor 4-like [Peromyscus eremicus]|uniref:vomeronasal type-1 receptor 4-like n=1 Tax=Peromyscus eremicus TaxID=42410 RepID=UPI0027DC20D5|nr:vomeronasal type-1 receptor 4-like [Peromyscus eremicus]